MPRSSPDSSDFKTSLGKSLAARGLLKKAKRVEELGWKQLDRDGDCGTWITNIGWNPCLRITQPYADQQAAKQHARLARIGELVGDEFAKLKFLFPLGMDVAACRMFIFAVRGLLKTFAPDSVHKIGTQGSFLTIKCISVSPLNETQIGDLLARLPRGADFETCNLPASELECQIRRLLRADLPSTPDELTALECIWQPMQQVVYSGAVRKVLCDNINYKSARKLPPPRPHNPRTFLPSLSHTHRRPMNASLTPADVDPAEWETYPDEIEVDVTTLDDFLTAN